MKTLTALLLACALFARWLAPHDPLDQDLLSASLPPAWSVDGDRTHLFGTDSLGRDILSRLVYGARPAMIVAFGGATLAALVGTVLGLWAGFHGGWLDTPILLTPGTFAVRAFSWLTGMACLLLLFYTVESLWRERATG